MLKDLERDLPKSKGIARFPYIHCLTNCSQPIDHQFLCCSGTSLGHYESGIIGQAVPDLIKELVDDGIVDMEKIGGSNFFWVRQ